VHIAIESLGAEEAARELPGLSALLEDAVEHGASIGFLPPMAPGEAGAYWRTVVVALREGSRVLLVARDTEGDVVGSAQLDLATRPNAYHRAEVMKVMVHSKARRRGIGRTLMRAIEEHARRRGRTTLVLDTRRGDHAERLYEDVGWTFAGVIPRYARSADGSLDPSAFYYKLLEGKTP
jgi:ribosomal protein S18 acetylase RimI-like enzyme